MDIFPNETIPSFMARTQLLAIHRRADRFYQSILDCSYTQTCGVATYRLKKLSALLSIDLDRMITEHTAYRYFAHYMPEKYAQSLRNAISGDEPKALELETGSVNSRLSIPNYHAFCPVCAERDIEDHGVAYWHQMHNLPGVSACYLHKCRLIRTEIRPKILSIPNVNQAETYKASDNEILFARLSAQACQSPTCSDEPAAEVIDRYKQQLDSAGYVSEAGFIRREKLLSDIRSFWGSLLSKPDFSNLRTSGKEHNFVQDVLNPEMKRTHPVKHILLRGFLDQTVKTKRALQSAETTPVKDRTPKDDHELVIRLLNDGVSLSRTARESGVSYYTVRKLAKEHGIKHRSRSKQTTFLERGLAYCPLKGGY